jgi:hypothetical protein
MYFIRKQKAYHHANRLREYICFILFVFLLPIFCLSNAYANHAYHPVSKFSEHKISQHIKEIEGLIDDHVELIDPLQPVMHGIKPQHGFEIRNRRRIAVERTEDRTEGSTQEQENTVDEEKEDEREKQEDEREKRSERSERQIEYTPFISNHLFEDSILRLYQLIPDLKISKQTDKIKIFEFIRYSYSPRSPPR